MLTDPEKMTTLSIVYRGIAIKGGILGWNKQKRRSQEDLEQMSCVHGLQVLLCILHDKHSSSKSNSKQLHKVRGLDIILRQVREPTEAFLPKNRPIRRESDSILVPFVMLIEVFEPMNNFADVSRSTR